ncbi:MULTISPECIES: acetyl-CoA carboxylase biotin carboxylase subunit [unclassified Mesorhizobium]|uniref:acetyl-CoA carboxylase biotin carboxylase subunit n=1 Tax=unclassified Mesorhizobium TaxID=325217 RepID=UPI000FD2A5BB|nr:MULTISPECIES: acetyl-CoA carboxylase biotin carboxylase subunit [unclassified Mesorhizobium]AZV23470.1 acetyl-CoA carboxylase biotin carboxylase subunit [Mesorhizobium sp. M7A.F.Ce.TU.012.03.2.1]RUU93992.1 acetyl-CoA carboxylase biotin carboxylase subunit [Mesorhizobium sp. M7A.F.Ca.MR.176.00.0.0]RVD18979.1 acetyl-CoA carboxylase biotin carboxylase subunit [Mesorhizobium sp. M7A.F.Ca.ET.027.02.1.1]RWD14286.1 MAG: acetyl-CoA carboxylase biotin carboxylase subunit [Mesorhizobium sp.]RWP12841.
MLKKLLVANRGEIAVRIIRAAQDLGIATVAVYSAADAESLHVQLADESVNIGPPAAKKSYLNVEAILKAARDTGCDSVHPGYGFLAENAAFSDAVTGAGLVFVGPSGDAIRMMGDKVSARSAAAAAGVPVVPGSAGRVEGLKAGHEVLTATGFPVMIKAAAGGGGRGIRIANSLAEFEQAFPQAEAEALAAFGDGGLYMEKVIGKARHIEVQVLADGSDAIHCYERECSLQRRRQKVWEEAPSRALSDRLREDLCASAVALAKAVKYSGAGTVEYLYDDEADRFYFIEMNTRIQVEHPVTEAITGIDLVAEMLRIAGGEKLRIRQGDVSVKGHAIEVRLNAEDPAKEFAPFPGQVAELRIPGGPGVRFDSMLYQGYQVPPFYDSLLAKLIVHAETREAAIVRLIRALNELKIGGLKTTKPLFLALAADPAVRAGDVHTRWLEGWLIENAATLAG